MEVKLDEKFFDRYFSRIDLGVRPPDGAEDETTLATAIGKLWSLSLEKEFSDDLWMSALIGQKPRSAIIEKTELTRKHSGDTLHISKAAALSNDGSLGTTHTLIGNEENLDISQVSFVPARVGNAVKWRSKAEHSVSFELRNEVKDLLASWAAEAVEKRLIAACDLCSAANTLFAGTATSKSSVTATDVIQATDLLRLYVCLLDSGAKGIQELGGFFALVMHPRQWFDLSMDSVFMSTVAAASAVKTYDIEGFVGSYSNFRIFTSNLCHSQDSGGSPGEMVYSMYALAARSLGLGWEQRWSWLEKGNVDYGETRGIGTDAWFEAKILNQKYLYRLQSAGTNPRT